jgi:hypothetical protein
MHIRRAWKINFQSFSFRWHKRDTCMTISFRDTNFYFGYNSSGLSWQGTSPPQCRHSHTEAHKHRRNAYSHLYPKRELNPQSQHSSGRRQPMPHTAHPPWSVNEELAHNNNNSVKLNYIIYSLNEPTRDITDCLYSRMHTANKLVWRKIRIYVT